MTDNTCTVGGLLVVNADVEMPYVGCWHIDGEASGDTTLSGAQTFRDHGIEFTGTIVRATVIGGRVKFRLVAGKGGLSGKLAAQHFARVTAGTVLRSILGEVGESLSTTVDASVTSRELDQWKINAVPASRALQRLCDKCGWIWRVLRDGTVWVGVEAFTDAPRMKYTLVDEDWSSGAIDIAPEKPELQPLTTFMGQQIRYVVHQIRSGSLRTGAFLEPPSALLDRFLAGIRQEMQFGRSYPCTVIAQNADGTLQLDPDDDTIKGDGLNHVPIRYGLPGFLARVSRGARVSLEFENGDESQPRASLWESGAANVISVEFEPDGTETPACRVGDTIELALPMNLPITTSLGPAVITVTTPIRAVIVGPGNPRFLL